MVAFESWMIRFRFVNTNFIRNAVAQCSIIKLVVTRISRGSWQHSVVTCCVSLCILAIWSCVKQMDLEKDIAVSWVDVRNSTECSVWTVGWCRNLRWGCGVIKTPRIPRWHDLNVSVVRCGVRGKIHRGSGVNNLVSLDKQKLKSDEVRWKDGENDTVISRRLVLLSFHPRFRLRLPASTLSTAVLPRAAKVPEVGVFDKVLVLKRCFWRDGELCLQFNPLLNPGSRRSGVGEEELEGVPSYSRCLTFSWATFLESRSF